MAKGYKKKKFYLTFMAAVAILAAISHLFLPQQILSAKENRTDADAARSDTVAFIAYLDTNGTDTSGRKRISSDNVWSYNECFCDSNFLQLRVAEAIGVEPMDSLSEVLNNIRSHRLVSIESTPYYIVDELTHSMPYMVPQAQQLLNTIGLNFIDSLISKGYPPYLPIVTSVLRTGDDIKRLRRGNRNSVTNSAHQYGTTVDITYNRFQPLDKSQETVRFDANLKLILAEVLFDLKTEGKCYVKYERRQACFHLTAR